MPFPRPPLPETLDEAASGIWQALAAVHDVLVPHPDAQRPHRASGLSPIHYADGLHWLRDFYLARTLALRASGGALAALPPDAPQVMRIALEAARRVEFELGRLRDGVYRDPTMVRDAAGNPLRLELPAWLSDWDIWTLDMARERVGVALRDLTVLQRLQQQQQAAMPVRRQMAPRVVPVPPAALTPLLDWANRHSHALVSVAG